MAAWSIGYQIHSINFSSPIPLPSRTDFSSLSFTFSNAKYPIQWNHIGCHRICALPAVSIMASGSREVLPPALDSSSEPPAIFDGTPKLYISYSCPYAQRTWIARNCKGLQENIKLVPIDLKNRPDWYKEKVYPANKVPSLEHNNEVKGESMDLIRYIDSNFEGPSLFPDDPSKREFAEELFSYFDSFYKAVISSLKEDKINDAIAAFDSIETALSKFVDGSFFLGTFSLVDIAYAPFIERFQPFLLEVKNYDITAGRTKLAAWIKEMNQIEAYTVTKRDPKEHLENYKRRFLSQL
ncbi:protein IN2-1 homolog B-like isoform X2 [Solanum dulcamara]|uniref:protein IN2-1 homolog B-like isoform X2 n=1 Tax=Solanum dulcamara TaxID=45834 RepID=UPI002485FCE9|nr:protein IN2-1 homolog B-like isoform X2 [Solanum dulcamara]